MTVSRKQLEANRKNAKKGGVKTAEAKAIVKYNALKHGLLAREAVVMVGEGAEDPAEFAALSQDLKTQLQPQGILEEMLVEKIAVAYWRLRRAHRYEVGLIRRELDTATDRFYGEAKWDGTKTHKTDDQIEQEIQQEEEGIAYWQKDKKDFSRMRKDGTALEEIYEWEENWEELKDKVIDDLPDDLEYEAEIGPQELRECLKNRLGWTDDAIWQGLTEACDERVAQHRRRIEVLEKERQDNQLRLQVLKMLGNIPSRDELDRLLRYEGAIERQFYKALNELERLQRLRAGENVPPPLDVNVDVSSGEAA